MKSSVCKISELFDHSSWGNNIGILNQCASNLVIPAYQREYTWSNERIISLLSDINSNSKFIGNIIFEETSNSYEIIDGQQRLTTCLFALVGIYNFFKDHPLDQDKAKKYLYNQTSSIILKNDSVGSYLEELDQKLVICIKDGDDIYLQKESFEKAFSTIESYLSKSLVSIDKVCVFFNHLLDSQVLILIHNEIDKSHPVEQLFLDINEKAQLLEVEDIFKGHCFAHFGTDKVQDAKRMWAELKQNSILFKKYGFKNTSEFIYSYLLETDKKSLKNSLKLSNGKHYIEEKTLSQTAELLHNMIAFAKGVNIFYSNLVKTTYYFADISSKSESHKNTPDHLGLKQMCLAILLEKASVYQKLPFMFFVQFLFSGKNKLNTIIEHDELKKIVTNYYIYSNLFVILCGARKNKSLIDHAVRDALENASSLKATVEAAKALRVSYVKSFEESSSVFDKISFEQWSFIHSIIDNYNAAENWLPFIYDVSKGYNKEHFILVESKTIVWKNDEEDPIDIHISDEIQKKYLDHHNNRIPMLSELNESLNSFDIVTKVKMIKDYYASSVFPICLKIFIDYLESMEEYKALEDAKTQGKTQVQDLYNNFVSAYFEDESIQKLDSKIKIAFINAFKNINCSSKKTGH